jgi:hypothetical protein
MSETPGNRRPDGTEPHELEPGEYALASEEAKVVWLRNPDGEIGHVSQGIWEIAVEEDGTITVSPSIWWDKPTGWHGFLERGTWRGA